MMTVEWCRVTDPSVNEGRPFAVERRLYELIYADQPLVLLSPTEISFAPPHTSTPITPSTS